MGAFETIWLVVMLALGAATIVHKRRPSPWYVGWSCLFWLSVSVFVVRSFFWEIYITRGPSMSPTIPNHSVVMLNKQAYGWVWPLWDTRFHGRSANPQDVVVFRHHANRWIKRVWARAGDEVGFDATHGWSVNGQWVAPVSRHSLSWLVHGGVPQAGVDRDVRVAQIKQQWNSRTQWNMQVPRGFVFVVGDNPKHSTDSRDIGFVPMYSVIARVEWISQGPQS